MVLVVPPVTPPAVEIPLVLAVFPTMGSMLLPDALSVPTEHPVRVEVPTAHHVWVV